MRHKKHAFIYFLCFVLSFSLVILYAGNFTASAGNEDGSEEAGGSLFSTVDDGSKNLAYYANKFGITVDETVRLKETLINAVDTHAESVDLLSFNINYAPLLNNIFAFGSYISSFSFFHVTWGSLSYNPANNIASKLKIKYSCTREEYEEKIARCEAVVAGLTEAISGLALTEEEKILYIHDWLCVNCKYDSDYKDPEKACPDNSNMCGPLLWGKAVCQGYTESLVYLLSKVGIASWIVSSKQLSHSWNIVQLSDGRRFYVDVTWDDPVWNDTIPHTNYADHKWFMISYEKARSLGRTQTDYDHTNMTYTDFDDYVWNNVTQPFILLDGKFYYFDSVLFSVRSLIGRKTENVRDLSSYSGSNKNVALTSKGNRLLYSLDDSVYRLEL
ncbi:MAG: hypothetical protein IJS94_02880, partial [Clostridia bacterium]|nr:hypothetical protein [Clostridia bacterium]